LNSFQDPDDFDLSGPHEWRRSVHDSWIHSCDSLCHTPNYGRKWTWVWLSCCRQPLEGGRDI
jgi:hypothetical protein